MNRTSEREEVLYHQVPARIDGRLGGRGVGRLAQVVDAGANRAPRVLPEMPFTPMDAANAAGVLETQARVVVTFFPNGRRNARR